MIVMKRALLFLLVFASLSITHQAWSQSKPSSKNEKKSGGQKATFTDIVQSAHGWSYVKGEWVHPDGYKYVKGQVLRTTAKAGKDAPEPPEKLALENPQKLTPKTNPAPQTTQTEAEKK